MGPRRSITGISTRCYGLCCPPRKPSVKCGFEPPAPGDGRKTSPCACQKPGPIPYNYAPVTHHGKYSWKKYMYIYMFICLPLIIAQALHVLGHEAAAPKEEEEYIQLRRKRFPWGGGVKSFFHNPYANSLPVECEVPPLECD